MLLLSVAAVGYCCFVVDCCSGAWLLCVVCSLLRSAVCCRCQLWLFVVIEMVCCWFVVGVVLLAVAVSVCSLFAVVVVRCLLLFVVVCCCVCCLFGWYGCLLVARC